MNWIESYDGDLINLDWIKCIYKTDNERDATGLGRTDYTYMIECEFLILYEYEKATLARFSDEEERDIAFTRLKNRLAENGTIYRVAD